MMDIISYAVVYNTFNQRIMTKMFNGTNLSKYRLPTCHPGRTYSWQHLLTFKQNKHSSALHCCSI